LWLRRSTYERETAWAPPHVANELRLMHMAERDAHVNALRAEHESQAAPNQQTAGRHGRLAAVWRALEAKAGTEAEMFAAVQEVRLEWERVTENTRTVACAADLELRRRHPGMQTEPLRPHPAEAVGVTQSTLPARTGDRSLAWLQPTLDGMPNLDRASTDVERENQATPTGSREAAGQFALGLTTDTASYEIPEQVIRIRENAKIAQAKLEDLAHMAAPGADEDEASPGLAWPVAGRERDAVLQPPKPDVAPSARAVERQQAAQVGPQPEEAERG
jgi:hypothetical protein